MIFNINIFLTKKKTYISMYYEKPLKNILTSYH